MSIKARQCPRCGGPLGDDAPRACRFCGAALEQDASPPTAPEVAPFHGAPGGPTASGATNVGAVVAVAGAVMVAGGVAAFVLVRSPSQAVVVEQPSTVTVTTSSSVVVTTTDGTEYLEQRCSTGDAQSCVAMGAVYQYGSGTRGIDLAKARDRYDRACKLGDASGCTMRDMVPAPGASTTPPETPIVRPKGKR